MSRPSAWLRCPPGGLERLGQVTLGCRLAAVRSNQTGARHRESLAGREKLGCQCGSEAHAAGEAATRRLHPTASQAASMCLASRSAAPVAGMLPHLQMCRADVEWPAIHIEPDVFRKCRHSFRVPLEHTDPVSQEASASRRAPVALRPSVDDRLMPWLWSSHVTLWGVKGWVWLGGSSCSSLSCDSLECWRRCWHRSGGRSTDYSGLGTDAVKSGRRTEQAMRRSGEQLR
jgi:hypothetical protein